MTVHVMFYLMHIVAGKGVASCQANGASKYVPMLVTGATHVQPFEAAIAEHDAGRRSHPHGLSHCQRRSPLQHTCPQWLPAQQTHTCCWPQPDKHGHLVFSQSDSSRYMLPYKSSLNILLQRTATNALKRCWIDGVRMLDWPSVFNRAAHPQQQLCLLPRGHGLVSCASNPQN